MTREKLLTSLATKKVPAFATTSLGFTLGHFFDLGATEEEVRALCDLLISGIVKVKESREAVASIKEFSSLIDKQLSASPS